MSFSTSLLLLVCLFGSCTPQGTQDLILSTLNDLVQKIDGLQNKTTSIEVQVAEIHAEIDSFKTMFLTEQEDIRTSLQQCCIRDQITTFQHWIDQDINECTSDVHLCSANATCTNTKGSYTCQCLPYYYGDGFTCTDCQTELNKAREVLLDTLNIGMDDLTPEAENNLIESLEQNKPQCVRNLIGSNCKELLDNGWIKSGVYTITPEGFPDGVEVYCDQETDGGGWSVILLRQHQSQVVRFDRNFEEYAVGFGDPTGEIWIGNRVLHSMTGDKPFTLRVDAKNLPGESRTGIWNIFSVGSQATQFTLSVDGYSSNSTLGDGLTSANGMKFSTYDRDNDKWRFSSCSKVYRKNVGWWFKSCGNINPTGPLGNENENKDDLAYWKFWTNNSSSSIVLSEIHFKIRP